MTKKLVRDKIPLFIKNPKFYIASENEYELRLQDKLIEEGLEFMENPTIEEYIDVLEVMDSIKDFYKFKDEDIVREKQNKLNEKGGFNNQIILEVSHEWVYIWV